MPGSPRSTGAIYALADDPDYMVFDADLLDPAASALPIGTGWAECMPVAVVALEADVTALRRRDAPGGCRYVLATDTGEWTAQQVYFGDAGEGVRVTVVWAGRHKAPG